MCACCYHFIVFFSSFLGSLPSSSLLTAVFDFPTGNLTACQYQRAVQDDSVLLVVTYVMAAVCLVCALPLVIVIVQWQLRKLASKRQSLPDPEAETVLTDSREH